jgi:hypothetical protein
VNVSCFIAHVYAVLENWRVALHLRLFLIAVVLFSLFLSVPVFTSACTRPHGMCGNVHAIV